MADASAWLLDTNISDDPHHPVIGGALQALVAQGAALFYLSDPR